MLISDLQNGQVLVVGAGSSSFLVNFSDTVFIVFMMQKITNAIKRKLSTLVINEPHITLTPFITVDFSEKSSHVPKKNYGRIFGHILSSAFLIDNP